MPDDAAPEIGAFLDKFWGTEEGRVYILASFERKEVKQFFPKWPLRRQGTVNAILTLNSLGWDMWFCPVVFDKDAPRPDREYVQSVNSHWLDFDGNAPENWETRAKEIGVPEPSLIVETSVKSHQQAFWFIDRVTGQEKLDHTETITRNLTAAFATDKSGWDLTQLLRVPRTLNYGWYRVDEHKPWYSGKPEEATILKDDSTIAPVGSFDILTDAEKQILSRIVISEIPSIKEVLALGNWTKEMFTWFNMTKDEASNASQYKRSGSLQALAHYGAEQGFTDEQIYSILDDADTRWEKYTTRSKSGRNKIFLDTIARARDKHGYLNGDSITLSGLINAATKTEEPDTQPKFIFNFKEFMDLEYKVEWLLDDLIPVQGFGVIVGQPGVGKSRLALQMGMELAIGSDRILHRKNSTGAKKVMFISLEMAPSELKKFLSDFSPFYKDQTFELERNFYLAPFNEQVPLDLPQGKKLLTIIVEQFKPDIIFIDSLQMSVSKSMQDELAMKALYTFVTELRKLSNVAVVFIHHNRKKQADQLYASDADINDMYGSQIIAANIGFALHLGKAGTYVKLDEIKNRLSTEKRDIALTNDGIKFTLSDIAQSKLLEEALGNNTNDNPEGPAVNF